MSSSAIEKILRSVDHYIYIDSQPYDIEYTPLEVETLFQPFVKKDTNTYNIPKKISQYVLITVLNEKGGKILDDNLFFNIYIFVLKNVELTDKMKKDIQKAFKNIIEEENLFLQNEEGNGIIFFIYETIDYIADYVFLIDIVNLYYNSVGKLLMRYDNDRFINDLYESLNKSLENVSFAEGYHINKDFMKPVEFHNDNFNGVIVGNSEYEWLSNYVENGIDEDIYGSDHISYLTDLHNNGITSMNMFMGNSDTLEILLNKGILINKLSKIEVQYLWNIYQTYFTNNLSKKNITKLQKPSGEYLFKLFIKRNIDLAVFCLVASKSVSVIAEYKDNQPLLKNIRKHIKNTLSKTQNKTTRTMMLLFNRKGIDNPDVKKKIIEEYYKDYINVLENVEELIVQNGGRIKKFGTLSKK